MDSTEHTADHTLTFDEELFLWLGDESAGVRAADAERIHDIAAEFARGYARALSVGCNIELPREQAYGHIQRRRTTDNT